jgi:glycosyltransferase involved in cell wall biosynthesis
MIQTPLRIAHVVNEPFGLESASGVQHAVYCLSRAQADIGQCVAVFSRESGVHVLSTGTPTGLDRARPGVRKGRSPREWLLSRYYEPRLAEHLVKWAPDIVHFHSVHIPENVALGPLLARAGIPYCVTLHGALFDQALRRSRLKKWAFNHLFERRYLNGARFIHAVSPNETPVIRGLGIDRPVIVVANGLPPDATLQARGPSALYAESPWLRGRFVFMFVGRLDVWQKGLDLLMRSFAHARLRDAALVLVGPEWRGSRRVLGRLAERQGVSSQVVFREPAFGEERANLLAAADVFVHPSRWEGLSLSVLTAAAAGKPCLITREADPLGTLERAEAAFIVDATVSSLTAGLRRAALVPREELQMMGTRGRDAVERHFSWHSTARELVRAYRTVSTAAREPH